MPNRGNNFDSNSSSSDDEPNILRQNDMNADPSNETAVSINQSGFDFDSRFENAGDLFMNYYREMVKNNSRMKRLQDLPEFSEFSKRTTVSRPCPDVFFLPTIITFNNRSDLQNFKRILSQKFENRIGIYIPKDRDRLQEVEIKIFYENRVMFYVLRPCSIKLNKKHKCPRLLEKDLSIDILYEFYSQCFEKDFHFEEATGIFLYWAYQKQIIGEDFFSASALKLLLIYLFITMGECDENFIYLFNKQKKYHELKRKYKVNGQLKCELDDDLFEQTNFSIKQTRSFYKLSLNRFTTFTEIMVVPFPVEEKDQEKYLALVQNKINVNNNQFIPRISSAMKKFRKMISIINKHIMDNKKIHINLAVKSGYVQEQSANFSIEIIHPIFGHNMCESFSKDSSKMHIFEKQVYEAYSTFQNQKSSLEAICRIFTKN